MSLHVIPLTLREANQVVTAWHRHHKPTGGMRFALGCIDDDGVLHGAAICGRPVARNAGLPRDVLEVLRVATDGTYNACSILLGAAARAGKALGYKQIQTYTLPAEGGASLRASGWVCEGEAGGGTWDRPSSGRNRTDDHPITTKHRWVRLLAPRTADLSGLPKADDNDDPPALFGEDGAA